MIKYPRTLAMTGKSRRDLQQKRGAGRWRPLGRAQGAHEPQGGNALPDPAVTGAERGASPGPEFQVAPRTEVRPEPSWLRAFSFSSILSKVK